MSKVYNKKSPLLETKFILQFLYPTHRLDYFGISSSTVPISQWVTFAFCITYTFPGFLSFFPPSCVFAYPLLQFCNTQNLLYSMNSCPNRKENKKERHTQLLRSCLSVYKATRPFFASRTYLQSVFSRVYFLTHR